MWKGPKEFFNYTSKERKGSIALFSIALLLWVFYSTFDFYSSDIEYDFENFDAIIARWESEEEEVIAPNIIFFDFDPNTIKRNGLRQLGLSERQISTFLNYRKKGAYFKDANDLYSVYSLDSAFVEKAYPFVKITPRPDPIANSVKPKDVKSFDSIKIEYPIREDLSIIELNAADSVELLEINGIGPTFAKRILRYRNLLGGFHDKIQLIEVYGIDSLQFLRIKDQIKIDDGLLFKMNINHSSFKELLRHPYFDYELVKALVNFRQNVREFQSLEELKNIEGMNDDLFQKIRPYLSIDN